MMTKELMHERSQAILEFAIAAATGSDDPEAECDGREVIAALDAARFVMLTGMAQSGQLGSFLVGEAGEWDNEDAFEEVSETEQHVAA